MILDLFGFITLLALVLIIIGFVFSDWSSLSLIGFAVLFILSVVILNTGLQYQSGSIVSGAYSYDGSNNLISSNQTITYSYIPWSDSNTHTIGYLFSIVGMIGMVFVLWSTGLGVKLTSVLRRW